MTVIGAVINRTGYNHHGVTAQVWEFSYPAWLHGLGITMIVARLCHAVGIKADTIQSIPRGVGAGGTLLVTLIAAGLLVTQFAAA